MQRKGKRALPRAPHYYERLLRGPLVPLDWTPPPTGTQGASAGSEVGAYRTMPELKRYLEKRWIEEMRAWQAASRGGADAASAPLAAGTQPAVDEADALRRDPSSKGQQTVPEPESETESETESEGR